MERAPIHFEDTEEFAKLALDVAGFSPEDIQVRMEDFIVSIDGKRTNKLGDSYVIRRRFRVDRKTVEEDAVQASLTDGILEILVPKKAQPGPRSIPISTTRPVLKTTTETVEKKEEPNEHTEVSTEDDAVDPEAKSEDGSVDVETVEGEDEDDDEKDESNKTEEEWEDVKE